MVTDWIHAWPTGVAAFFASLVEFVEALTVVLAVGIVRGWRGALLGTGSALAILLAMVLVLGPALARIPVQMAQLIVGALLLLFGMRWLRKAILRYAGVIPLHDEAAAFERETQTLRLSGGSNSRWDAVAVAAAFKITMLEGLEVVFIVIAFSTGGPNLLIPASVGAIAALLLVVVLGLFVHKPLSTVPENTLKFVVGIMITALGTFWVGEGLGLSWPKGDWSILSLAAGFLIVGLLAVPMCKTRANSRSIPAL
jgi:uncharacterized membrane protein